MPFPDRLLLLEFVYVGRGGGVLSLPGIGATGTEDEFTDERKLPLAMELAPGELGR